jgi:hypothetical protein
MSVSKHKNQQIRSMKSQKQKFSHLVISILLLSACSKERVIQVGNIPANTPKGSSIYLTGDFNNWNPADYNYKMEYDAALNVYSIGVPDNLKHSTYKYSRGSIESIESDKCGNENPLRLIGSSPFKVDTIESWMDVDHIDCPQITFVIQTNGNKNTNKDTIYLATETNQWNESNPEYLFHYTINGLYCLTVNRTKEKVLFTVFRGGQNQFNEPQELPSNNDTIMLTLFSEKRKTDKNKNGITHQNGATELNQQMITLDIPKGVTQTANQSISDAANSTLQPTTKQIETQQVPSSPNAQAIPATESKTQKIIIAIQPTTKQIEAQASLSPKPRAIPATATESRTQKKVIVIIDQLPTYGKEDNLYLASDFNNWDIADPNFMFKPLPNGKKYLMLRLNDTKSHEFKITRGEVGTGEADFNEQEIDLHEIAKGNKDDTIHIRIDRWLDDYPKRRLVIYLTDVPENTPMQDDIYLTGNFNKWNTRQEKYKFTSLGNDRYALAIEDFNKKYIEYKITRGSMETEATTRKGGPDKGERFDYIKRDTIKLRIERWKDLE